MKEIGGEFWEKLSPTDDFDKETALCGTAFLLSGRTALDFIIHDIMADKQLKSVALPSYCCESMIEPFIRNRVQVSFYVVTAEHVDFEKAILTSDAILLLDFFGYEMPENKKIARMAHDAGKVVIYDSTPKLNGNAEVERIADYSFISYRKWFYSNCAKAIKYRGAFFAPKPTEKNYFYCSTRNRAAQLKAAYISGETKDKTEFLHLYRSAEEELDHNYANYAGEPFGVEPENIESIVSKRRRNAMKLQSEIASIPAVRPLRTKIQPADAPLFFPILVSSKIRDRLKQHLIEQNIYTPVHWPFSDLHQKYVPYQAIYSEELSLICDQRYSSEDMEKQADIIKLFFTSVG